MSGAAVVSGRQIARLREQAGLTQSALARAVDISQSQLSRIETGDREVASEDTTRLLVAINSDESNRLAERLRHEWKVLSRVPLDHPNYEALWAAECAGCQLVALTADEQITASFQRRIEEYLKELRTVAELVLRREHNIAFIGSIGVGKSTAICKISGLEIEAEGDRHAEPVLEAGSGGITLCEVHVYTGPSHGITIQACADEEIYHHVGDFADHISRMGKASTEEPDGEFQGISGEIERAIRNMSGLRFRKEKIDGKTVRIDTAREVAANFLLLRDFAVEIRSRMQLHRRDVSNVWFEVASGKPPLVWLEEVFAAINNGRHRDFTLPKRIEVIVPTPVLPGSNLPIRIIDTKGIDRTAARADLENHLIDPHALAVLCTRFNSAPGTEAQLLFQRARDAGVAGLPLRSALLVLPYPSEALAVKDDAGEKVETVEEGYELKREQIQTSLEPMNLRELPIAFFNAREESPDALRRFLIEQIEKIRLDFDLRLEKATANALQVVSQQELEQTQAVLHDAAAHLKTWLKSNGTIADNNRQIEISLLKELERAHVSTVRASIRRAGDWPNFSYQHQLGHGARVLAAATIGEMVRSFRNIADNLRKHPDFSTAGMLIAQTVQVLSVSYDELLRRMQLHGEAIFNEELRRDLAFWRECESEWGKGPGYRERILNRTRQWFAAAGREELNRSIRSLLSQEWETSLRRVGALLEVD